MDTNLFVGNLVRLSMDDPEKMGAAFSRWGANSEYLQLLDTDPIHLWSPKKFKEWFEKDLDKPDAENAFFTIHTLEDDRLIGFTAMFDQHWNNGDSLMAIGLGEPEFWGKGYGADAMRLVLNYAFRELNLHRVSLFVFEYNSRAIRMYEKVGFKVEGRWRKHFLRFGRRWDVIVMGILRSEWEALEQL